MYIIGIVFVAIQISVSKILVNPPNIDEMVKEFREKGEQEMDHMEDGKMTSGNVRIDSESKTKQQGS